MKIKAFLIAAFVLGLSFPAFAEESSFVTPATSGLASFLLSPGDRVAVQVYRETELSGTFIVSPNGNVNYPLLGDVRAEGLTLEEFRRLLLEKLAADYLVDPQVKVDIVDSPTNSVAILGQVNKPGNYPFTPEMSLVRLVSQAGGFTRVADPSRVRITRSTGGTKKVLEANAGRVMEGSSPDIPLVSGDLVFVAESAF